VLCEQPGTDRHWTNDVTVAANQDTIASSHTGQNLPVVIGTKEDVEIDGPGGKRHAARGSTIKLEMPARYKVIEVGFGGHWITLDVACTLHEAGDGFVCDRQTP
jgi:hypothetical protein